MRSAGPDLLKGVVISPPRWERFETTPEATAPLPQGTARACSQALPFLSGVVQAGLSALPAGGPPSLLSVFPRKQLTGLAVLFLEMFNRPSSGRGRCWRMGRKGRPRAQRHLHPGLFPGASEQQPSPNTTGCQLWGVLRASAGLTSSLAGQLPASLLLNEDRRPATINYNTQQLQLMHCLSRRKLHRGHLPAAKGHSRQWLQLLWQPRETGQACRWAEEPWQLPEVGTSVWCGAQSRPWLFCLCTINL